VRNVAVGGTIWVMQYASFMARAVGWRGSDLRRRRGNVSLEFAILAAPLFTLALGTMEVGYDFFVQEALDNAVHVAARGVQVGAADGSATGTAATKWVSNAVCPALGGLLDCGQLYVNVTYIPSGTGENYYTYMSSNPPNLTGVTSSANSICTGSAGKLMLLQAYYLSPTFLGMLIPAWSQASPVNSSLRVHVTYSSSGFVNEYFSGGETGC
jgi:Flp pilus assembly protein TadG